MFSTWKSFSLRPSGFSASDIGTSSYSATSEDDLLAAWADDPDRARRVSAFELKEFALERRVSPSSEPRLLGARRLVSFVDGLSGEMVTIWSLETSAEEDAVGVSSFA